jgi:hypothetical protein
LHKFLPVLLSLSNIYKIVQLFASPDIRSATDKTKKSNLVLLHKQIQLFCLSKSIYKKIVKCSSCCMLHK